jgi:predicted permease
LTSDLPPTGINEITKVQVAGRALSSTGEGGSELMHHVSPAYFATLRIPILRGRDFGLQDNRGSLPVVIINEGLAHKYWGTQNPLGAHLQLSEGSSCEVVGVIGNVRQDGLSRPPVPELYLPLLQAPLPFLRPVAKVAGEPLNLVRSIREEARAIDPKVALDDFCTLERYLADQASTPRYAMTVMLLLAALGLLLAMAGIYGVIANIVAQRTREIGIRIALGAQPRDILRMTIEQGMWMVLPGVLAGVGMALGLTRLLASLLFGVSASDPATFILVPAILVAVALLACWIPARGASRINPMVALRCD